MADLNEIVPVDNAEARRDLLKEQFDEVEAAPTEKPAPAAEPARDNTGKNSKPAPEVEATEPVEEPVWKRPPASWKKDFHEVWQGADDKLKEYAHQREEQMKAGIEPLKSKAQYADQMQEVIAPYLQTITGLGLDAPKAVKALMEADHLLRTSQPHEKPQILARLAQSYGINLSDVGGLQQQAPVDPQFYAIQNEVNSVRGELQIWKQQQEQQQNQVLLGEINQFSQKVEHFEEARPVMIQLLHSGVATDLQDAYEKAIRLDQGLFETVYQNQQVQADAAKRAGADRAAKAARAAAVSVRGSTPGAATQSKAQDRRALLAEQFDSMSDRL